MKLGDNLGDTKIRGTEKPVLSLFFICNAFLLSASSGFPPSADRRFPAGTFKGGISRPFSDEIIVKQHDKQEQFQLTKAGRMRVRNDSILPAVCYRNSKF